MTRFACSFVWIETVLKDISFELEDHGHRPTSWP